MSISTRPPLGEDLLNSESAEYGCFKQGYRLGNSDLNILFFDSQGRSISPYSVSYEVGYITEADNKFHRVGIANRIPIEIRTGRFRPNFQVGDKWNTGNYEIRWNYQVTNGGAVETISVPFLVITKGIYDFTATDIGVFNLQATVVVIP
jgi:hypothetical protein